MRMQWAACLLLFPLANACSEPGACLANVEPGVEVEVRDAVSDDFLSVVPLGVVREGTYQDSLRIQATTLDDPPRVVTLAAADERSGRYTVHINAEGYQAWDTAGVNVAQGDCHVQTAQFTARLIPAP